MIAAYVVCLFFVSLHAHLLQSVLFCFTKSARNCSSNPDVNYFRGAKELDVSELRCLKKKILAGLT